MKLKSGTDHVFRLILALVAVAFPALVAYDADVALPAQAAATAET